MVKNQKANFKNFILEPFQEKAVNSVLDKFKSLNTVLLNGNMGTGKSILSITVADRLKASNVIYFTEPRLISGIINHDNMDIVAIPYSKLRHTRHRTKKVNLANALKSAKEIIKQHNLKKDSVILGDEIHNIKNIASQRGLVFICLWVLLEFPKTLLFSGTIKSSTNSDLLVYLVMANRNYNSIEGLLKELETKKYKYIREVPMPFVSKFATKEEDINTDELKKELNNIVVRCDTITDGNINMYIKLKTIDTPKTFNDKLNKLKRETILTLPNNRVINYSYQQMIRLCDGYVNSSNMFNCKDTEIVVSKNKFKINYLQELLKTVKGQVIILCAYRYSAKLVSEHIGDSILYDIQDNKKVCENKMQDFKEGKYKALISTVSALSTGFNLDNADTMIYYSINDNQKDFNQSIYRITRKTSVRDKYYYFLLTNTEFEKNRINKALEKLKTNQTNFGFITNWK